MTRTDKETIVSGLRAKIDKSKALFLTNLIGVASNDANILRKNVREADGSVVIARNTLFRKAAEGTSAQDLLAKLKGPSAVAFAFEDAPGVAKALYDAGKEHELIELRGGLLGDQELTKADVEALAKLPSRDQMLATVLATFNAPVGAFVRVLDAIREQKESGGEAAAQE